MEHRQTRTEIRIDPSSVGPNDLPRKFWARVVNYNVIDDYGTEFAPGVFTQGLAARMPRLLYGHNGWGNIDCVLGRAIDSSEQPGGLDVLFEFDDPEYVPSVRQVAHQMMTGTLDQFSVGFVREADENGQRRITQARLGEVSVVIEGAVPGTKLLAFTRSARGAKLTIPVDVAARLLADVYTDRIDLHEGLGQLKAHALDADNQTDDHDDDGDETDDVPLTPAEQAAADQAAAEAQTAANLLAAEAAEALADADNVLD